MSGSLPTRFLRLFALIGVGGAGAVGCTGADAGEAIGSRPDGIRGGQQAPEVFQVLAVVNFAGGQCTGVPIAPDLVLTARHCIGATEDRTDEVSCDETTFIDPDSPGALFVLGTPALSNDPLDYLSVVSIRLLPGDDSSLCGRDVALLRLERALTFAPLIPRVDQAPIPGEGYSAYGYGSDGPEGQEGSGVRRQLHGLNVVCIGTDCADVEVRASEWLGSGGVCSGDSGGPALDALGRILGVVSRGREGCRSPVYTSVPAFSEWLSSEALAAASAGHYDAPAWALGHSTDPRYYQPIGAPCSADPECGSGLCASAGYCTRECALDGPCPRGYRCEGVSGVCQAQETELASSCALGRPRGSAAAAFGCVLLLWGASRRTWRRS